MNWKLFFLRRKATHGTPVAPNPFEELRLGTDAQSLLDSHAYQRAIDTMRVKIHEQWAVSPVADAAGHAGLRTMLYLLDSLDRHIREEAATGKLAKRQIDDDKRKTA